MNELRNGMWVSSDQGVGIYTAHRVAITATSRRPLDGGAQALPAETVVNEPWVHLTDASGNTLAALPAERCSFLRQADAAELPAARVGHLSFAELAALGYL